MRTMKDSLDQTGIHARLVNGGLDQTGIHAGLVNGDPAPGIGDGRFTTIAGPRTVESRDMLLETAQGVKAAGAHMLRGGA